ncbi:hypothetical protein BZA05DRAFT_445644 [Tricharina praecox]|uniref:uncharacterized protein n=1 Tax=Tricharina praecox TaxID=43433 RepID=UPI0022209FFB|nr:uncharacterized protein BZA05DRAFT_445644 [Tricharina praecox]KAI5850804.1 hypothetical protein BZA05DRAFT_445644 [Tricharina praecox]
MNSSIERMSDEGWDWKVGKITEQAPAIIINLPGNTESCVVTLIRIVKVGVSQVHDPPDDPPATLPEPAPVQVTDRQRLTSAIWQHGNPVTFKDECHWMCKHCVDKRSRFNRNSGSVRHHMRFLRNLGVALRQTTRLLTIEA